MIPEKHAPSATLILELAPMGFYSMASMIKTQAIRYAGNAERSTMS